MAASSYDYFISGDHEAGRGAVASALEEQGYRVQRQPDGALSVERGSFGASMFLGALAGKNFHITFTVQFFVDDRGTLVARLNRNVTGGALKGGAIGASKAADAFNETGVRLQEQLGSRGLLLGSTTA